jgi:hypothetical protein
VSSLQKDAGWTASELAERMDELFGDHQRAYRPSASPFRRAAGLGGSGSGSAAPADPQSSAGSAADA